MDMDMPMGMNMQQRHRLGVWTWTYVMDLDTWSCSMDMQHGERSEEISENAALHFQYTAWCVDISILFPGPNSSTLLNDRWVESASTILPIKTTDILNIKYK
jgi:hypothetical protein